MQAYIQRMKSNGSDPQLLGSPVDELGRRPFMTAGEWMAIHPRSVRDPTDGRIRAPGPRTRARQSSCAVGGWDP